MGLGAGSDAKRGTLSYVKAVLWWVGTTLGAIFVPFVSMGFYLTAAGDSHQRPPGGDPIAIIVSVGLGLLCVNLSPLTPTSKWFVSVLYFFGMSWFVLAFAFMFVCSEYRACL